MAKDGIISSDPANGTVDTIATSVLAAPRLTLAELFKLVVSSTLVTEAKKFVISFIEGVRKLEQFPTGTNPITAGNPIVTLTKDDPTKKAASPMSDGAGDVDAEAHPGYAALQAMLRDLVATRKPSVSGSAVINAVDGFLAGLNPVDDAAKIADLAGVAVVINQAGDGSIDIIPGVTVGNPGDTREVQFVQDITPAAVDVTLPFEG